MRQKLSDQEFHALYCPAKNPKSALFLVAFLSLETFLGWKGLHKAPERPDFITLIFLIFVAAMLAKPLANFTCFRDRVVFVLVIGSLAADEAFGFFPAIIGPHVHLVNSIVFALWVVALLVSLTMLVQSARSPNAGASNAEASIAWQPKRNLLIWVVVILTVLVLGAMLYFVPFRQ
jgi:hypothetical protein